MSEDLRPIVIKRIKKGGGGHHGGAWKIAYADFVTAMMAFFLLMWLLGSTAGGDLKGIADFFQNPLKVSLSGGSGAGDATSILKGGGEDITRTSGQVRRGDTPAQKNARPSTRDARTEDLRKEFERRERMSLSELKGNLESLIERNVTLRQFKNQLLMDVTTEGLRIQIIDEKNRPMFDSSSAELNPYSKVVLKEIGKALNAVPNKVSISGHTDAAQFSGGEKGFSNWELSANRANASRREMIAGGMDENKVLRVVGSSSTVLFDKNDPLSPSNRRINIVVLNKRTEEAMLLEDGNATVTVDGSEEAAALAPPEPVASGTKN